MEMIRRGRDLLRSPGSVSVSKIGQDLYDVVICNNYAHNVSRHFLDGKNNFASTGSCRLLAKGLDVPDGISHSHSGEWLAVSNHYKNAVFIFRNDNSLDEESEPIGKLRVIDNETFIRGHTNPQEGGPKGIDLTSDDRVLVVSREEEPIVFFDVRKRFETLSARSNFDSKQPENITETEQTRLSLLGHINLMAKSNANARAQIDVLKKMVEAGTQERNALIQQLNDMKVRDS